MDEWLRTGRGVDGFFPLAWSLFERGRRGDIFDQALRQLGANPDPAFVRIMVSVYRNHRPAISMLPDAAACLSALHPLVHLAVISDGPLESQQSKVDALRLDQHVDYVLFTAILGDEFAKPHPRAFQAVQERFHCKAEDCFYVGDNPKKDFRGPAELGWKTIRVRRPGGLHFAVEINSSYAPAQEILDLYELIPLLKGSW